MRTEPNLTPLRFFGPECLKCGCHVRYVNCKQCVRCNKDKVNKINYRKQKTPGLRRSKLRSKSAAARKKKKRESAEFRAIEAQRWAAKRLDPIYLKIERDRARIATRNRYRNNSGFRNKAIMAATNRNMLKFNRIPVWADLKAIKKIYDDARERGLFVDHMVPLQGRTVSGLHVEYNLRAITFEGNASKGNKLLPEFVQ